MPDKGRYIIRAKSPAGADSLGRILALPDTETVRQPDRRGRAVVLLPTTLVLRLHDEFPDLTIEEDVQHLVV